MGDDSDDLLEKADALMRRRRAFVAGATDSEAAADGDVPLLTEVVSDAAAPAPGRDGVDVAALRSALACELEAWLDEELPQHVMRVLDGLTDQLVIQLALKARAELLPRLQALVAAAEAEAPPRSEAGGEV